MVAVERREEVQDLMARAAQESSEEERGCHREALILIENEQLNKQNDQTLMGSTLISSLIFINNHDPESRVWPQKWKKWV